MPTKIERIRAVLATNPTDPFAWYSLAMEQRKTDVPAALETFAKVRAEFPDYVANYYHYGQVLFEAGEVARAKEIYREGMTAAKAKGDMHAYGELEAALLGA